MDIHSLITREPFSNLFSINPHVLEAIQEDMACYGYDISQPIVVWSKGNVVIDGHTRLEAAENVGIEDVPVILKDFPDEYDALVYAFHNQRNRRHSTDAEILRAIELIDKRQPRGGDRKSEDTKSTAQSCVIDPSSKKTAKAIGISPRKVEQTRTVIDHAPPEVKEAVKTGGKTINQAYHETQERRRAEKEMAPASKPTFNQTNDNIEWAKWSWNPVVGCLHDCPYCYARDIAIRFYNDFKPRFHQERLTAPYNTKPISGGDPGGRNVFVCSMADLFGKWVPQEWIDSVIDVVRKTPDWNYLFLTKNPRRYVGINFPVNAWVGATADTSARAVEALKVFSEMAENGNRPTVSFLSCEPLLESIHVPLISLVVDWVIIGGRSKNSKLPEMQPEWEWVETLLMSAREGGVSVYFKPNLIVRPKEYPH